MRYLKLFVLLLAAAYLVGCQFPGNILYEDYDTGADKIGLTPQAIARLTKCQGD
ncbi:hypothetical protein LCGC14_1552860 [marine sediment metagenome]|uniref:Uncharacterized protein n=1 Tax=marine sediment metagenome TaxID=412755 RepID=A0A0F9LQL6_9ZZZZ